MNYNILTSDQIYQLREEIISEIMQLLNVETKQRSFIKAREVCERLQCSHGTLYNLRKHGILSGRKVGGTYYYSVNEIDSYMQKLPVNYTIGQT